MKKPISLLIVAVGLVAIGLAYAGEEAPAGWAVKASIIEACSCPMFCQCYFNAKPASHHGHGDAEHFCRFNNAFEVEKGHHGETDLSGVKFWVGGDLGAEFDDGRMDWARLHFEPSATPEQRAAIAGILGHVYPVEWNSFEMGEDAAIEWRHDGGTAVAKLGGGEMAEVRLTAMRSHSDDPVVIENLPYWGLPRHEGFVLMPNEIEAYRVGEKAFEYGGGNGFMITFELTSADVGGN